MIRIKVSPAPNKENAYLYKLHVELMGRSVDLGLSYHELAEWKAKGLKIFSGVSKIKSRWEQVRENKPLGKASPGKKKVKDVTAEEASIS